MSLLYLITFTVVMAIIFIAGLTLLGSMRTKGSLHRALNMTLFLVRVPRETNPPAGGAQKTEKDLISIGEQLLSGFSNMHSKGWNKFLYGEPYLSLEMAVHHIGEETHFYIAVPKSNDDIIEKQIYGYYPTADVSRVKDYSIFNPEGANAGAYLKYTTDAMLPLKTYQKLESDPIGGVLTAMSKLQIEGEGAAMQLLIRPSHAGNLKSLATKVAREMQLGSQFKEALQKARYPVKHKPGEADQTQSRTVTPADEEVIKAITAKTGKQTFDVNIRLIASAPSQTRAEQILQDFQGAFVQFSSPDLNGLKATKLTGNSLLKLIYDFSFRLFDNKQAILMSTEEITSLYHFPVATTSAPRVKFLNATRAEPPANMPTEGIIIGQTKFRGQDKDVRMKDEDRRRHVYIIGQTGTGKSVAMQAMIRQDIDNGMGVTVIDPHGPVADWVLGVIPQTRADDVIYFNPADIDRPLGMNMLEYDPTHPEQKTLIVDELFGIFEKLFDLKTTGGPMFEKYFKNSLNLLLDDYQHDIPTLTDIMRVMNDDAYRIDKLSRATNPITKLFWEQEAAKTTGEQSLANLAPYISSKIEPFVSNEFLRPIVNQQKSAIDFHDIIENKKILIVNLSKGRIGNMNADLMGMVIVGKLQRVAMARDTNRTDLPDHYLYIDEFHNFSTDSIATILSEARKYRLCLIMAHQYIKQLKETIRDAVFGNVGTMTIYRISPEDAESSVIKTKFEPVFTPADIANLEIFNSVVSLLIDGQVSRPFNMVGNLNWVKGQGSAQTCDALIEISRLKFGRPRAEVEEEINARFRASGILKETPPAPRSGSIQ